MRLMIIFFWKTNHLNQQRRYYTYYAKICIFKIFEPLTLFLFRNFQSYLILLQIIFQNLSKINFFFSKIKIRL